MVYSTDLQHAYVFRMHSESENKTVSPSCDHYYDPPSTIRLAINSNGIWLVPVGDVINSREFTTWSRDQNNACAPLSPCSTPPSTVKTRDVIHHVVALRCRPVMPRASIRAHSVFSAIASIYLHRRFVRRRILLLQYTADTVVVYCLLLLRTSLPTTYQPHCWSMVSCAIPRARKTPSLSAIILANVDGQILIILPFLHSETNRIWICHQFFCRINLYITINSWVRPSLRLDPKRLTSVIPRLKFEKSFDFKHFPRISVF